MYALTGVPVRVSSYTDYYACLVEYRVVFP